jgi:hypothetical protein
LRPRLPTFLIVGAMRSGTTSLARYLGAHPDVYMAPEKEVHFFDRHFDRGLDWYGTRFAEAGSLVALGEATQVYMYDPLSMERIADVLPEARLIAILRDPIQRAYSHYRLNRALGIEPLSFGRALRAEPSRLGEGRSARFAYSYVDRGKYLEQLEQMAQRLGRHRLHIVLFDDMRDRPFDMFRLLCDFLSVDPSVQPASLGRKMNEGVEFRSLKVRRLSREMPPSLARVVGRINRRRVVVEPMDDDARSFLLEQFRDDVHVLSSWLGRPVQWAEPPTPISPEARPATSEVRRPPQMSSRRKGIPLSRQSGS